MADHRSFVIGLDMGTGGARALAVDFGGRLVAESQADLAPEATVVDGPRVEQDPAAWTVVMGRALRRPDRPSLRPCQTGSDCRRCDVRYIPFARCQRSTTYTGSDV